MVTIVFLQSLLIAWFLYVLAGEHGVTGLFRIAQGSVIIFAILVPVFVLLEGFQDVSITSAFFIPLVLYAVMFPLFNSLIHHLNLFVDPAYIVPALAGGIGFGLIGLGGYQLQRNPQKAFGLVTAGVTIIFLSSPVILAGFLSIVPGIPALFPVS